MRIMCASGVTCLLLNWLLMRIMCPSGVALNEDNVSQWSGS
jgi:hypothetical protein